MAQGESPVTVDIYILLPYNIYMKKRTSILFEDEDRRIMRFLQEKYGLDSESSVLRFLIRKAAKEEGYTKDQKEQRKE